MVELILEHFTCYDGNASLGKLNGLQNSKVMNVDVEGGGKDQETKGWFNKRCCSGTTIPK